MAYCTAQDLIDRIGEAELIQLTDRLNQGAIDTTVLNQAIADANAEIDGYLIRFIPLAVVPANLVRIACDIARYYLFDDLPTDQVKKRYDDAVKYLTKVSEGKISLAPDANGTVDLPASGDVEFISAGSVFANLDY